MAANKMQRDINADMNVNEKVAEHEQFIDGDVDLAEDKTKATSMSRMRVLKNLLVMSVAFMFLFTAFQSLQNLQSSLNKEAGLGTISLSVIYGTSMVAGLCLPPLVISHLGTKWSVAASMVCYIVFMAANMYPVWGTMIPASIIIGLGAAPLWAAKCTYLTHIGVRYARLTNSTKDATISAFFGFFFMMFQTSGIWGNLIASVVFSQEVPPALNISDDVLSTCGANYCPSNYINNTNLDKPNMTKIYTVCGIYLASACIALLIVIVFLDKLPQDSKSGSIRELLSSIMSHFYRSRYQKLLIPITVYSGIEQAFAAGEFTRSFISCSVGVWNVGFIMIVYGVTDALCSMIIGRLVKYTSFKPWFAVALVAHGGTLLALLFWTPVADSLTLYYVFAILWGLGDAIIQTLINALYGHLFTTNPEASFASYRLCESCGFILAFGYSSALCTNVKIIICLAVLVVGTVLYTVVEILYRRDHPGSETNNREEKEN